MRIVRFPMRHGDDLVMRLDEGAAEPETRPRLTGMAIAGVHRFQVTPTDRQIFDEAPSGVDVASYDRTKRIAIYLSPVFSPNYHQ